MAIRRPNKDSHEYEAQQGILEGTGPAIGTTIPYAEYLQRYAENPNNYQQTRGMTAEQFASSPYSQWVRQPDGSMRFRGTEGGWQNPTWIDQGGAGSMGLLDIAKRVAPYAGIALGAGAALGGLSGLGIPGLFGEAAPAIGEGISPTLAQAAGGVTDFNMAAAANAGDLAALGGETYLPGAFDTVPTSLGQFGGAVGDPFIDAYTSFGTGGGPTGLPLPGQSGFEWLRPNLSVPVPSGRGGATDEGVGSGQMRDQFLGINPGSTDLQRLLGPSLGGLISGLGSAGLGNILTTGLGMYASNQQANALEKIANQARADRAPFLNSAIDMLNNPGAFYQRPEVMGAVDASLRGLSAKVGNPINNPGAIAQQAAYNTGLYNNALTSRANLGLAGQDTTSQLQTNAAIANTGPLRQLGSGLGSMFSTSPNISGLIADLLMKG